MGRFTKTKKEEGEFDYPKLNNAQLKEITELYIRFKSINRILRHWSAVNLDTEGNIVAVCDFTDYYAKNDENKKKYEDFQPIKGIKYMGLGYVTYMPYQWASEWLATWSVWITKEADRGDLQALSLVNNKKFSTSLELAKNL